MLVVEAPIIMNNSFLKARGAAEAAEFIGQIAAQRVAELARNSHQYRAALLGGR